jgi:hypothetical protein
MGNKWEKVGEKGINALSCFLEPKISKFRYFFMGNKTMNRKRRTLHCSGIFK